jgi:anti-anti-sigma regulatory factor
MNALLLLTRPHTDSEHITVVGPLDRTTCQEFYDTAGRLLATGTDPRPLTVNLRCCTFVDDTGLETLDALRQLAEKRRSVLRLEAVPPLIEHLLCGHGSSGWGAETDGPPA